MAMDELNVRRIRSRMNEQRLVSVTKLVKGKSREMSKMMRQHNGVEGDLSLDRKVLSK